MFKKTLLFGAVAFASAAPLTAQEAETAAPAADTAVESVVKHISSLLENSWQSTFALEIFEGEKKEADATVALKFMDAKHFCLDIAVISEDEFEGTVEQIFTVVADGSFIYLDSPDMAKLSQGMMSGPVKVELAFIEKMIESQAGIDISDGGALKGMLADALEKMNLKADGGAEGKRRFLIEEEKITGFLLFDAETWLLDSAKISAEGGTTIITTSGSGKVNEWPEGTFAFTAAEGVVVTDITAMMKAMMPMEEESDEDLEF